jgi:ABC-type lipopolysaccharide export system ATPase subunit
MYVMTGATSFATCLIVGLHGPALAGLFAMLPWMVMGLVKTSKGEQRV